MLDRSDAIFILCWFAMSFASFGSIYFTLRRFKWFASTEVFDASWRMWLIWLISSYLAFPIIIVTTESLGLLSYQASFYLLIFSLVGSFIMGTIALTFVIRWLHSRTANAASYPAESELVGGIVSITSEAMIINLIAWISTVVGILIAGYFFGFFERFFPPQESFGIYDIF